MTRPLLEGIIIDAIQKNNVLVMEVCTYALHLERDMEFLRESVRNYARSMSDNLLEGLLDCPKHEPLHNDKDGCPAGCK